MQMNLELSIVDFINFGFAFAALCISLVSLFLQHRVRGARIDVLNANDIQRSVIRPHSALPKNTQDRFPDVVDQWAGYALVKLIYGNSGDRAGIANIKSIGVRAENSRYEPAKVWRESYSLVPAYEIVEEEVLLRNIPLLHETSLAGREMELEIDITIEWGSYHPRRSKYLHRGTIEKALTVILAQGDENPPPRVNLTQIG